MKRNIFFVIGVAVIVVINAIAFSQKNGVDKSSFNVATANQSMENIQKNLASRNDYNSIVFYVRQIDVLENGAMKCVNDSESHLKDLNELLKSTEVDHVSQLQRADFQYLQGKQTHYIKQLSECRLFVYRSREAMVGYKETLQKLSTNQILKRVAPIWKIQEINWLNSIQGFDFEKMVAISGLSVISLNQWVFGCILLCCTLFIALYLKNFLSHFLKETENIPALWRAAIKSLSKFVIPCSFFAFTSAFLNVIFQERSLTPTVELASHAALVLMLTAMCAKFLFYPSKTISGAFLLPQTMGKLFYRCTIFLATVLFAGYVVAMAMREQAFPAAMFEIARTLFVTGVVLLVGWIFLLGYRSANEAHRYNANFMLFLMGLMITLFILVVVECLGYHSLAVFLVTGLLLSVLFTIISILLWRLMDDLYNRIDNKQYSFSRKVRQLFGVKFNKKMHEIFLIKLASQIVILSAYVVMILKSWSISPVFIDLVLDGLWHGFKFSAITITPSRIVLGLVLFAVILLIGRFFATSMAQKHRFKGEEDTQIAISTITVYISFSVALIFSMLVIGVDFTGLAIIAGALSVGVGLGLQNIVNNFVSGLILLIEKPIKPGDRIVIGKTEGFVRKIRIRSTQIATLAKEDVIVPNADLITQQVTNYMFRDRNSRIACQVGVAYGSDTNLVRKILLEVAEKHAEVVHEAPNEPVVLFSRFGESALIFDLLCVIHDVNKKSIVVSDLNFAIDAAFRQHQIDMAFPQREIHIKDYTAIKKDPMN